MEYIIVRCVMYTEHFFTYTVKSTWYPHLTMFWSCVRFRIYQSSYYLSMIDPFVQNIHWLITKFDTNTSLLVCNASKLLRANVLTAWYCRSRSNTRSRSRSGSRDREDRRGSRDHNRRRRRSPDKTEQMMKIRREVEAMYDNAMQVRTVYSQRLCHAWRYSVQYSVQ